MWLKGDTTRDRKMMSSFGEQVTSRAEPGYTLRQMRPVASNPSNEQSMPHELEAFSKRDANSDCHSRAYDLVRWPMCRVAGGGEAEHFDHLHR